VGDQRPVIILLESQAAIARLQHTQPGPGQALVIQAHAIAKRLHTQGRQPTIQWVPGHAGVKGNEKANQVAKQAAGKPPGRGPKEISLAFARRARTEVSQHKGKDGSLKSLDSDPSKANEYTGHRRTGGSTLQL